MTPAQLAAFDQSGAALGAGLDRLVEVYRRLAERRGSTQAACDITAFVNQEFDEYGLSALLGIAVERLAEGGAR